MALLVLKRCSGLKEEPILVYELVATYEFSGTSKKRPNITIDLSSTNLKTMAPYVHRESLSLLPTGGAVPVQLPGIHTQLQF